MQVRGGLRQQDNKADGEVGFKWSKGGPRGPDSVGKEEGGSKWGPKGQDNNGGGEERT